MKLSSVVLLRRRRKKKKNIVCVCIRNCYSRTLPLLRKYGRVFFFFPAAFCNHFILFIPQVASLNLNQCPAIVAFLVYLNSGWTRSDRRPLRAHALHVRAVAAHVSAPPEKLRLASERSFFKADVKRRKKKLTKGSLVSF